MFGSLPFRPSSRSVSGTYPNGFAAYLQRSASPASLGAIGSETNVVLPMSIQDDDLRLADYLGKVYYADGRDIRPYSPSLGWLPFELEYYNPVTGVWIAWVLFPTLDASKVVEVQLFYSKPDVPAVFSSPSDTWRNVVLSLPLSSGVDQSGNVDTFTLSGVSLGSVGYLMAGDFSPEVSTADIFVSSDGSIIITATGDILVPGGEASNSLITSGGDLLVTSAGDFISQG